MKAVGGARRAMKPQETRDRLNRNIAGADLYLIACGFLYRSTEALSVLVQVGAGPLHSKDLHSRTWFAPRGSASVKVQFPCEPFTRRHLTMGASPNRHPSVNGRFEPLPLSETVREFDRAKGGDVARDAKRRLHLVTSTPLGADLQDSWLAQRYVPDTS